MGVRTQANSNADERLFRGLVFVAVFLGIFALWLAMLPTLSGQETSDEESVDEIEATEEEFDDEDEDDEIDVDYMISSAFHRFHINEMELVCSDCHESPDEDDVELPREELAYTIRPEHGSCDICHDVFEALEEEEAADEMVAEGDGALAQASEEAPQDPRVVCTMCHLGTATEDLGPFPSGRLNLAGFSHAEHVDQHGTINKSLGIRQDCVFCHQVAADSPAPKRARHPQCGACHAGDEAVEPLLDDPDEVTECFACHDMEKIDSNMLLTQHAEPERDQFLFQTAYSSLFLPVGQVPRGSEEQPYRDIRPFNHGTHLKLIDGTPINCGQCHAASLVKRDIGLSSRPTMHECATCHDNRAFVRGEFSIDNCEVCHLTINSNVRPRRSDPISKALIHSEKFREQHETQAWDPEQKCMFCHTGARDASQNGCSGCHATMKPKSHLSTQFKERAHGRMAGFDRKSCSTCHTADSCARCHNKLPRSHVPLASFAGSLGGAHRDLAAINIRSCFTCHTFEDTCAKCHVQGLP